MKRIIITDDSQTMRNFLKRILEGAGFDVIGEAKNGQEAVEMYKELKPDLIIMDIVMPDISGMDALNIIREIDSNANVIMCTSMSSSYFKAEAREIGVQGFIVKPFSPAEIIDTINRVLDEG